MPRPSLTATILALCLACPAGAEEVVVFAAASLKGALDEVAADYRTASGNQVTISYGGSNALAKQILAGAPADIFISAAPNWMDEVAKAGLVSEGSRVDLLGNSLALIAPGKGGARVPIGPNLDLAGLLAGGKLSMAMVDSVPAGQYGKAALQQLGIWDGVKDHVAQSENVRAALQLVALGEASLGIVYSSDVGASDAVSLIGTFPQSSHPPILYPAALLAGAADPADRDFFHWLAAKSSDDRFAAHGFVVLTPDP